MINNSIAIYSNPCSSKMSINYNIWTDFGKSNYLDISININEAPAEAVINVFVPFIVNDVELKDLSPLYKSESIATGILDCPVIVKEFEKEQFVAVHDNQQGGPIAFIQLTNNNYSITILDNSSTVIKFQLVTPEEFKRTTIIFRIPFKSFTSQIQKVLSNRRNWLDVIATPIIQRTIPFDFRINEVRSLPISIVNETQGVQFQQQRFFINVPNDIEVDRLNCQKVRGIETDIFSDYFPSKCYKNGGLSYMWKKGKSHSTVLSTILTYRKWSIGSICFYLLIISLINIFSGILVSLLF